MAKITEADKLIQRRSLIDAALLDISIDVQNELLKQCKKQKLDDCQIDNLNVNTISTFELNKEKYIKRLMSI